MSLDKLGNRYEIQPDCLQTYNGIDDLHRTINRTMFDLKNTDYALKKYVDTMFSREEKKNLNMLKEAEKYLEKSKNLPKNDEEDNKEKNEDITGSKDMIVSRDENKDSKEPEKLRAIVLLQRLIKGRNEQNKM